MFQSLFGSLLNYRYGNENVSLRRLSWICIISILTTIYSPKNCSVYGRSCHIYSSKSFRFFRKEFRQVSKKLICYLPAGRSVWWKTVFQDRGHSFSPYGPPSRKITYISFILFRKIKLFKVLSNLIIVAAYIEQFEIWKILYTWNAISKFPNILILRKFSIIFDNLKKNFIL